MKIKDGDTVELRVAVPLKDYFYCAWLDRGQYHAADMLPGTSRARNSNWYAPSGSSCARNDCRFGSRQFSLRHSRAPRPLKLKFTLPKMKSPTMPPDKPPLYGC